MKPQAHIDARLSEEEVEYLAGMLLEKQRELARRILDLRRQVVTKNDCSLADAADAASLQENRLRAQSLIEQHQWLMDEIDEAMYRVTNGTYGVSEETGEPIDYDRLALIPWARTAVKDEDP